MQTQDQRPFPSLDFEPAFTPQEVAAAKVAIAEQRQRRNEIDDLRDSHAADRAVRCPLSRP